MQFYNLCIYAERSLLIQTLATVSNQKDTSHLNLNLNLNLISCAKAHTSHPPLLPLLLLLLLLLLRSPSFLHYHRCLSKHQAPPEWSICPRVDSDWRPGRVGCQATRESWIPMTSPATRRVENSHVTPIHQSRGSYLDGAHEERGK